jgi:hypothetical protein
MWLERDPVWGARCGHPGARDALSPNPEQASGGVDDDVAVVIER